MWEAYNEVSENFAAFYSIKPSVQQKSTHNDWWVDSFPVKISIYFISIPMNTVRCYLMSSVTPEELKVCIKMNFLYFSVAQRLRGLTLNRKNLKSLEVTFAQK